MLWAVYRRAYPPGFRWLPESFGNKVSSKITVTFGSALAGALQRFAGWVKPIICVDSN